MSTEGGKQAEKGHAMCFHEFSLILSVICVLSYGLVLCHVLIVALVDVNRCSRYSDRSFLFKFGDSALSVMMQQTNIQGNLC